MTLYFVTCDGIAVGDGFCEYVQAMNELYRLVAKGYQKMAVERWAV